jgi:hypothetical protein
MACSPLVSVIRLLEQIETALRTSLRDRPVLTTFGQHDDPLPFRPT